LAYTFGAQQEPLQLHYYLLCQK